MTQVPASSEHTAPRSPRTGFLSGDGLRALHGQRKRAWLLLLPWSAALIALGGLWLMHVFGWPPMALPVAVILFVTIGWSQFAISNALHEATHHNLGAKQRDSLAAFLTAWPIGFTMAYREIHLDHHRYFGDSSRDPDYRTYSRFPSSRVAFGRWFLFNLSGIAAIRQFFSQNSQNSRTSDLRSRRLRYADRGGLVLVQSVILAALWLAFGTPLAYLLFWFLPLAMVAKALSATRTLCEHGDADGRLVLRTITGTPLQSTVMGLFGFDYHAEHHLYPTVPFAALPRLHELHEDAIAGAAGRVDPNTIYKVFDGGHMSLLASWLRALPLRISANDTK